MNDIVKVCVHHGELNISEVMTRGAGYRCKKCHLISREKNANKIITLEEIKEKIKYKSCSIHGKFNLDNIQIDGTSIRCKPCRLSKNKEQREKYADKYKKKFIEERQDRVNSELKQKRLNNLEEFRAYGRKKYRENRERLGMLAASNRSGIALNDYEKMIESQNNLCAICGNEETRISTHSNEITRLCLDHNHSTGLVRELLCAKCNSGLGKFDEDIERLQSAINYLKKHQET